MQIGQVNNLSDVYTYNKKRKKEKMNFEIKSEKHQAAPRNKSINVKKLYLKERKPVIHFGAGYDCFGSEVLVDGKTSKERSITDEKRAYTTYGYCCYFSEEHGPYMVREDMVKLKEECDANGESFLKKYSEILGLTRHIDDNTTLYIWDNLSTGQTVTEIVSKDSGHLEVPVGEFSWEELYDILDNLKKTENYCDNDYWKKIFSNYK